jgi:integral membrane protein (TIGR01906 family)
MSRSRFLPILTVVITLLVPVMLVMISVRVIMTEAYLALEYSKPDFPPDFYGFTQADRLSYAPFAVQYLLNGAGIEYLGNIKQSNGQPLYNERELSHMVDVKTVTQVALAALGGAVALFVLLVTIMIRTEEGRRSLRQGLLSGGVLMLVILAGLVMYVLLNWDAFFNSFHALFFAEGTWRFEYSDSLIRLFPERFWQDAALTIGVMSAIGALLIIAGVSRWARRESSQG